MAKIQIKNEKITPFGGIFPIMDYFDRKLGSTIDSALGLRCKFFGYEYREIIRSLMCIYFCGGSCIEDLSNHLFRRLSLHPELRTCSSDTVLRAIEELTEANTTYVSDSGNSYDFNTAEKLNNLLLQGLIDTGQLVKGGEYDLDFDHQFIETEKYDAKQTYKHFLGYGPGIALIGNLIVGIENRDGNANVRFYQQDTLQRIFLRLEAKNLTINRARMDCGSFSEKIIKVVEAHSKLFYIRANRCTSLYDKIKSLKGWKEEEINYQNFELTSINIEKWGKKYRLVIQRQKRTDGEPELWEDEYTYRCIITNDYESSDREVVEYYNLRGGKERVFDEMNNGFGWNHLPKSFMKQNAAFLLLTAFIYNFYKHLLTKIPVSAFALKTTSRIKTFVFKFVSVSAKWIKAARQHVLNIYSDNMAYANLDFG